LIFYLRYFNAAGADPERRIGEWHTLGTHAIPIAIETALGRWPHFKVLGTDDDTRDGSCVRDFVTSSNLPTRIPARSSISWATARATRPISEPALGTSVKELLEAVQNFVGRSFSIQYGPRREGDSRRQLFGESNDWPVTQHDLLDY
jgi:UDP-glucose 4-epimerase